MYNMYNAAKNSQANKKKLQGPNADRVNTSMAPGAYNMPKAKATPDWMGAASGGFGDNAQAYYKSLADKPYYDQKTLQHTHA
jgi:hypothetical protein